MKWIFASVLITSYCNADSLFDSAKKTYASAEAIAFANMGTIAVGKWSGECVAQSKPDDRAAKSSANTIS